MTLQHLEHCAIRTNDLKGTRDFFVDMLGLEDGERPPFPFPGHWLYSNGIAVIHLFGNGKDQGNLKEYMGIKDDSSLEGSGSLDHIAFRCDDLAGIRGRLDNGGYDYKERTVPGFGLHQVFVMDPNGVTIELNFPQEEVEKAEKAAKQPAPAE